MCGIAGLFYQASQKFLFPWEEFQASLDYLERTTIVNSVQAEVLLKMEVFFKQTQLLKEFSSIETLFFNPNRRQQLKEWADLIDAWEVRLLGELEQIDRMEAAQLESWNEVLIQGKDLSWALRNDVLSLISHIEKLMGATKPTSRRLIQAWKLATTLNNIGRMEVRGRDSCGICLRVSLELEQYQNFLSNLSSEQQSAWASRQHISDLVNLTIRVLKDEKVVHLLFIYKVAQEVGALGDNVRALSESITTDELFWRLADEPGLNSLVYAHSRWASNGIISQPNCHPVDEVTLDKAGKPGSLSGQIITSCLNGDIDNYQELKARLAATSHRHISKLIGTDTKIIPVLFDHYLKETGSAEAAFCKMVSECVGSFAIVLETTADPDHLYLALKGSGQSLFVGLMEGGYVLASELYGVVEQTQHFIRMDGTTELNPGCPETAGQIFILDRKGLGSWSAIKALAFNGSRLELSQADIKLAEITTRDIDRKGFHHYLHKEISEAPSSVEKTLRGKFTLQRDPFRVKMNLGESVLPQSIQKKISDGSIRRVLFIGQGTAAVAGQAVATFMEQLFGNRLAVSAMKGTELSGYKMVERMDDSLIIAISQSGTTTDTNRTIDLARDRGASVIGIVNRRNSDMTFKVDGVLYTSDGRDIEMSVASTKAFYSQVVAGYLLVFRLAQLLEVISDEVLYRELEELSRLPALMNTVLGTATQDKVRELANQYAPERRDWAVVGSGMTRAAADEIRIKLAELCYKSIATDQIEDKKHIDLSSEPLTLILTAGLNHVAIRDAVKEVAIFRSHRSIPIVVCAEDNEAFAAYAAGVVYVPKASPCASVLLNVMIGHLWGYFCALAIDDGAKRLREARALVVSFYSLDEKVSMGRSLGKVIALARRFQDDLLKGRFNSSLSVQVATELMSLLSYLVGTRSLSQFASEFQARPNSRELVSALITAVSKAIHELSRPIDAIKHQAKTITVGISRTEETFEGPLFEPFLELGLLPETIPYRDAIILRSLNSVVCKVAGATLYQIDHLGILGEPGEESTVQTLAKVGIACDMVSRSDHETKLIGTKEWAVRNATLYLGRGSADKRSIAIVPIIPRGRIENLVLLHLQFLENVSVQHKVEVLQDLRQRYDNLKSLVTERDVLWRDDFLADISIENLILTPVKDLAANIVAQQKTVVPLNA